MPHPHEENDKHFPNATFNKGVRMLSGALGLLCAALLLIAVCTFFTRGTFANLFLLGISFGGAIAGWTGFRQKPELRTTLFFGHVAFDNDAKVLLVEPAYAAISLLALVISACLIL